MTWYDIINTREGKVTWLPNAEKSGLLEGNERELWKMPVKNMNRIKVLEEV